MSCRDKNWLTKRCRFSKTFDSQAARGSFPTVAWDEKALIEPYASLTCTTAAATTPCRPHEQRAMRSKAQALGTPCKMFTPPCGFTEACCPRTKDRARLIPLRRTRDALRVLILLILSSFHSCLIPVLKQTSTKKNKNAAKTVTTGSREKRRKKRQRRQQRQQRQQTRAIPAANNRHTHDRKNDTTETAEVTEDMPRS